MKRKLAMAAQVSAGILAALLVIAPAPAQQGAGKAAPAAKAASNTQGAAKGAGWTTIFDGTTLNGWNWIGNANWEFKNGYVEANNGVGFLVSQQSYRDFQLRAELWSDDKGNSGVFLRCQNPADIGAANAYEVNVYDARPDPRYRTGAIVDVSEPLKKVDAAGKWNTIEVTAQGPHLTVSFNGVKTVDTMVWKWDVGPIGLQYSGGTIRFRKVELRRL